MSFELNIVSAPPQPKKVKRAPIVAPPAAALPVDEVVPPEPPQPPPLATNPPNASALKRKQPLPLPPPPAEDDSAGNRPSASTSDMARSRQEKVAHGVKDRPDPAAAPPAKKSRYASAPQREETSAPIRKEDPSKAAALPQTLPLDEKTGGLSAEGFNELPLDQYLQRHLAQRMELKQLTPVQKHAIPYLLCGGDLLVRSPTGTGKTLAYAVPVVQSLVRRGPSVVTRAAGTFAVVLVPTRELCLQTHEVIERLATPFPWLVTSCLMGGERRKAEKARLRKGVTLLVGTPGRVSDHCEATSAWRLDQCSHLVLDEADRLLDLGFQQAINTILQALEGKSGGGDGGDGGVVRHAGAPARRQTILLSATLTKGLKELAGRSLTDYATLQMSPKGFEHFMPPPSSGAAASGVTSPHGAEALDDAEGGRQAEQEAEAVPAPVAGLDGDRLDAPSGLMQSFVLVPTRHRLTALLALIRSRCAATSPGASTPTECKMIVFVSSCDGVDFLYELLAASGGWPDVHEAAIAAGHAAPTDEATGGAGRPAAEDEESDLEEGYESDGDGGFVSTGAKRKRAAADEAAKGPPATRRGGDGLSFECPLVGTTVLRLHGKMSQRDRTHAFVRFRRLRSGVMIATDVAARGLNLEGVHWIVQHDLPQDAKEYLHRAGRTARLGQRGHAVLMLHPTELPFLNLLREASVSPKELKFASLQGAMCPGGGKKEIYVVEIALQKKLEAAVNERAFLHQIASAAYQSYLRGYAAHSRIVKRLVHVGQLHLGHLAKSFGLKEPPSKLSEQVQKRQAGARSSGSAGTEYLAGAEYLPRDQRKQKQQQGKAKSKAKVGKLPLAERMRKQKGARPVGMSSMTSEFAAAM